MAGGKGKGMPVRPAVPFPIVGQTLRTPMRIVPGIVSGVPYASGRAMGSPWSETAPRSGILHTINVVDLDKEQLEFDIVILNAEFGDVVLDNAAFDLLDGDAVKLVGKVTITAADFIGFNDNAIASLTNIGLLFEAPHRG